MVALKKVMILEKIIADKKNEVTELKREYSLSDLMMRRQFKEPARDFAAALKDGDLSLIAEIKKASPSVGLIRADFNVKGIAKAYEAAGAKAISVITEGKHFLGKLEHLSLVKEAVHLPILRKDFIIDEFQIYESKAFGADAILLIAAILADEELVSFIDLASKIGLSSLVEVHDEAELERALGLGAKIIGINNRNLNTFEVDMTTSLRLRKNITPERIVVSESGVRSRTDIQFLKKAGIDAVLIGEALMREDDIKAKIDELFN